MHFPAFMGGIRGKLITIFVLIKVVPLLLLAGFAWLVAGGGGGLGLVWLGGRRRRVLAVGALTRGPAGLEW